MKVYRVKAWNEFFESAKSREYNHRSQSYTPNKHGLGYRRILASEHGEAVFGCWMATCQVLSRQEKPRHGYLTDTGRPDGIPYGPDDIALVTGYSVSTCEKMLEICSSHGVGWLDVAKVTDTTRISQSPAKDAQDHYPSPLPSPLPSPVEGSCEQKQDGTPPQLPDEATTAQIIAFLQASHRSFKALQDIHIASVLRKYSGADKRKVIEAVRTLVVHYAGDADLEMPAPKRLDTYLRREVNGNGAKQPHDAARENRKATGYSISRAIAEERDGIVAHGGSHGM